QAGLLDAPRADLLSRKEALEALGPLLGDESITKDGSDLKGCVVALRRAGVDLRGLGMDVRLGSYLFDPTGREHSLHLTARERISCELPVLRDLCERTGKGKKATPLAQLPLSDLG